MGLFSRKKPPQNVEEQIVQSPRTRFNFDWAHVYEKKRLPGPGTNNYAFELLGLVEFSPIGPSEHNRLQWNVVQPQPLYTGAQSLWLQGFGGLSQGTVYSAPLVDPTTTDQQYP